MELLSSGSRRFGAVRESSKEGEGRWKLRLQNDMSSTGVAKLKPYHVSEVLRTLFDADVGLALFRWAKDVQGVKRDEFVYSALFGLLGRGKDAAGLARAVEEMREDGCSENEFTLQALAAAYARAGRFEEALATLAALEHGGFSDSRPSTAGARVDVLFRMGRYRDVIKAFNATRRAGETPDEFIYNVVIACHGRLNNSVAAEAVFKEMISRGMVPSVSSVNTLMEGYGSVGRIDDAMAVFDRMCLAAVAARTNQGGGEGGWQKGEGNTREGGGTGSCAQVPTASPEVSRNSSAVRPPPSIWPAPDMITYRSALNLLGIAGRLSEAEATFEAMLVAGMHPDAMAWSTLVLMWARESNPERAAMWFDRMLLSGCQPNAAAYNALLLAFVSAEMFDEAEEVLSAFKNGWDVVGRVGITPGGEKHTNLSKHKPEKVPCSTGETMGGHGYVRPGRALNLVRGKVLNLPVGERPDLMTYTMLLNACTTCTARSGVGRLMRLMEETEHPAHSVFQLLLEGFEAPQSVCRMLMEEAVSEGVSLERSDGGSEGGKGEGGCGTTERDAVARMMVRGLVEQEVREVLAEWEAERWREVERRMRGAVCTKADVHSQRGFSEACISFLHKFGQHERAARMWDLCHTRLQLFTNTVRLPAIYGRHGKCLLDLHGMSGGTAVTVTRWALEKMRQAVVASAASGAPSGAFDSPLGISRETVAGGTNLMAGAVEPEEEAEEDEEGAAVGEVEPPGSAVAQKQKQPLTAAATAGGAAGAAGGGGALSRNELPPLQWRRPGKVEVVTGWGKRSRVQGALLVKAAVEALLLRDLTAPFSLHRSHPGSYEALGVDLEQWLLTPVPSSASSSHARLPSQPSLFLSQRHVAPTDPRFETIRHPYAVDRATDGSPCAAAAAAAAVPPSAAAAPTSIHSRGFTRRAERGRPLAAAGAAAAERVTPEAALLGPARPSSPAAAAAASAAGETVRAAGRADVFIREAAEVSWERDPWPEGGWNGMANGAGGGRRQGRKGGNGGGGGRAEGEREAAGAAAARAAEGRRSEAAEKEWNRNMEALLFNMLAPLQTSRPSAAPPAVPSSAASRSASSPATSFPPDVSSVQVNVQTQKRVRGRPTAMGDMVALLQQQWTNQQEGHSINADSMKSMRRVQATGQVTAYHVTEVLRTLWDADAGLALFRWAKDVQGMKPDTYVYSSLFGLLGRARDAASLKGILEEMEEDGCEHNAFTLQALASAYARAGRARVNVLYKMGRYRDVIRAFREMRDAGHTLDSVIYNTAITCYGRLNNTLGAEMVFKEMIKRKMQPDVRCVNSLMDVYGSAGRIDDAMAVFDRMCLAAVTIGAGQGRDGGGGEREQNVSLLSEAGRISEAEATFEAMLVAGMQPDAVAWATMVLMWAQESNPERAAMWFKRMVAAGCRPNASAYNALLVALVSGEMFDEAEEVLSAFKNGRDLVGQVGLVRKDHSGSDKRMLAQAAVPTLPWVRGDSSSLWSGQTLNQTGGKAPNWLPSEPPNLMTYVMLLNVCMVSTAGNTVSRLMRLLEATEHPAHAVLQLLLKSLEPPHALSHLFVDEGGSEGGSEGVYEGGSAESSCGKARRDGVARVIAAGLLEMEVREVHSREPPRALSNLFVENGSEGGIEEIDCGNDRRDVVARVIAACLVEMEVREVVREWEEERWQEVESRLRGDDIAKTEASCQRAFAQACIAFLHKFGRHEQAARLWDLCCTQLQLFPNIVRLPAIYGREGKCVLDLHGVSAGTAVTVTRWALEKMRQAVVASAASSGAFDSSLEVSGGTDVTVKEADLAENIEDAEEEAPISNVEPADASPGKIQLQWRRPGKVEVVTGWGKRSRVQGASLVKAAVEALLLRELTAPFSLHRFHPGSYEASGADLEQWLLSPGVDKFLAPKNED
ncbi:unnamed protein product [Closterium sp. NIES-65]|nr:unnamed protein product [Closterium sp. NIES-65]